MGNLVRRAAFLLCPVLLAGSAAFAGAASITGEPRTGFAYDVLCLQHAPDGGTPETPKRLESVVRRLSDRNLLSKLEPVKPRQPSLKWITAVHSSRYIARVRDACRGGKGYIDTPDVPVSAKSYKAAMAAAGSVMSAVDAVMAGSVRNAFCAIRPPGHHALRDKAMGFCIFNNVAIAARYVQKRHGLRRVLIVDWDVHHGNGTQAAFYRDSKVYYLSVHRADFYPGTGGREERGSGAGRGSILNIPLAAGSGDAEYVAAVRDGLAAATREFKPDFVLVSAGFDAREGDPLGGMKVTDAGYAEMTKLVKAVAGRYCKGRVVSVLEGGYDTPGLASAVEAHLRALME